MKMVDTNNINGNNQNNTDNMRLDRLLLIIHIIKSQPSLVDSGERDQSVGGPLLVPLHDKIVASGQVDNNDMI